MTAELGLSLCTQSQNLLFQEFLGVVQTAAECRKVAKGNATAPKARFPWHERPSRDVHWDRTRDVRVAPEGFYLLLARVKDESNRSGLRRQRPLFIPYPHGIPRNCVTITIHYAVEEKRFYLLFRTKERAKRALVVSPQPARMGVDLGQIRAAACMAESGESLNVNGRGLRSIQQGLCRKEAFRRSRIDRKKRGSKNREKEAKKLAGAFRRGKNQAQNFLHTTSRRVVDFAECEGVRENFIGDPDGVRSQDVGRRQNQANHFWPTGQLTHQIVYKAKERGIAAHAIGERGTTSSCPVPDCAGRKKPKGRIYRCPVCAFTGHRDAVGGWNILVRGCFNTHGPRPELDAEALSLERQKYLTPVGVRGVRRSPVPRNPFQVVRSAEQPRSEVARPPKHVTRGRAPVDGMEQATGNRAVLRPSGDEKSLSKS